MTPMSSAARARDIARELALVVPRTVSGLNQSTGWVPTSPRGMRQFGEVFLDELVLSGFSLLGGNMRPLDGCAAAAEELSVLGLDGAHADPEPLRIRALRRHRIGGLSYERMTFRHEDCEVCRTGPAQRHTRALGR